MEHVELDEILRSEERNVDRFAPFAAKMEAAGLAPMVVRTFHYYYNQLVAGHTGYVPNALARPVHHLPEYGDLGQEYAVAGEAALDKVAVVKLNGGLGTSMGMNGPKSLLTVKDGLTFLDITVEQIVHLRERTGARLPLVLMNSFNTRDDTLASLAARPDFTQDVPLDFVQHKTPKVTVKGLHPAEWPADPQKEWNPPGHGDIYLALATSGLLDRLLHAGYRYAFVSNIDNLGATFDPAILGYFVEERLPFLMEVASRTAADSKGGHLALHPNGRLILRELAQCPPDELDSFQDITLYRYFNTNSIWLDLQTLKRVLQGRRGVLGLPLIRNEKPVDPTASDSPRVYQLETAMGSAIAVFVGAQALHVPRSRFLPVKKNNDLLLLWSDVYRLRPDFTLELAPERHAGPPRGPPLVYLDDRYYQLIDDLHLRFPHGAPSLIQCSELRIRGDVRFGRHVTLEGRVELENEGDAPLTLEDGAVIRGGE